MPDKSRERNTLSSSSRNQSFNNRRGDASFLINEPEDFDYLLTTDDSAAPSGAQTPRHMRVDSKEHLGEMATNIRGISMALSKVCISLKVHSILVVTKLSDDSLPACARELSEWILASRFAEHGLTVSVQDVFKEKKTFGYDDFLKKNARVEKQLRFWSSKSFKHDLHNYDMVITLGGDGTVLFASWIFQEVVPPVLSFSMGSLSFMTEHNFENFKEVVTASLDEGISATLRMRLCCTIMRTKRPEQTGECDLRREIESSNPMQQFSPSHYPGERYVILNDVVVDRGPNPVMTMTELYGNYEYITSISADGVVISTPSGSTAYSMSAGGPLTHPDIPATVVTPVCPHSLSFRPLLLPDSMVLKIGVPYDARSPAFASFDGKKRIKLNRGDFMLVTASRYPFPKIIPKSFTSVAWVQQLSNGLHWNDVRRPKRLTY